MVAHHLLAEELVILHVTVGVHMEVYNFFHHQRVVHRVDIRTEISIAFGNCMLLLDVLILIYFYIVQITLFKKENIYAK